jgi:catechol 2,3-dioxygenase
VSVQGSAKSLRLRFSHLGICVVDLPGMEKFYTEVMGFTVTDRGQALGVDLVFLSRDPRDHHQIVLGTGRPSDMPGNTANPMFGPCINQISFALADLSDLRAFDEHLACAYPAGDRLYANHGTAWSIYVPDPEGNLLEIYVDTEWFCHQPVFEPLDLAEPDAVVRDKTLALAQRGRGFRPAAEWREQIGREMAGG